MSTVAPTNWIDPINAANELISLADVATDEGRDAEPYLSRAEAILDAVDLDDCVAASSIVADAVAWLAS